jgi:hypothetical protein
LRRVTWTHVRLGYLSWVLLLEGILLEGILLESILLESILLKMLTFLFGVHV